jgi:hypothetical protein
MNHEVPLAPTVTGEGQKAFTKSNYCPSPQPTRWGSNIPRSYGEGVTVTTKRSNLFGNVGISGCHDGNN